MSSKVKVVAADEAGAVINVSKTNPDWGYVRLEQVRSLIDDNGFLRRKTISTLIQGEVSVLAESGFSAGQELPGVIVIEESLEPFNKKNPERDYKVAGETGIICKKDGKPIYRRTKYSGNPAATDVTIQHDNVDELREAYARAKAPGSAIQANTDFDAL
jgi:hypothetical protein